MCKYKDIWTISSEIHPYIFWNEWKKIYSVWRHIYCISWDNL